MKKQVKRYFIIEIGILCLFVFVCGMKNPLLKERKQIEMTTFYCVRRSGEPWGDFSDILYNGFITNYKIYDRDRRSAMELLAKGEWAREDIDEWLLRTDVPVYPPEQHLLVRTGPFYVDFSDYLEYCSETGKKWLEEHCPELKFDQLVKFHIPELHWEKWDKTRDEPAQWPKGEVEGYIINEPHSQACADSMPEFYEIFPPRLDPGEVEQKLKENENRPFIFKILSGNAVFINQKGMEMYKNPGMSSTWNSHPVPWKKYVQNGICKITSGR